MGGGGRVRRGDVTGIRLMCGVGKGAGGHVCVRACLQPVSARENCRRGGCAVWGREREGGREGGREGEGEGGGRGGGG